MEKIMNLFHKTNRWHRVGLVFVIVELRLVPSGQYGFTCNDPALSHPFTGDTITWKWLLATVVLFPLVFLLIAERLQCSETNNKWKKVALNWYKEYMFGVMLNLTIIGILKQIVGSPRPHFFDTCKPQEATTCVGRKKQDGGTHADGLSPSPPGKKRRRRLNRLRKTSEFIPTYTCTKGVWINQSDKSFPSGHASLGVHTAIFLAYYLHRRFHLRGRCQLLPLQMALVGAGAFCGLSRMWDHRHHWWDVLAGTMLAMPVLYYTIFNLCQDFNCNEKPKIEATKDTDLSNGTLDK